MKYKHLMVALVIITTACSAPEKPKEIVIGSSNPIIENGILTPEVLWSFGRLGETTVSPNGALIAYTVSYYSIEQNKSNSDLYIMNADGSNKKQLTLTSSHEFNPVWVSDSKIAFISTEGETAQIWAINTDGSDKQKISSHESDINGFKISPKGDKILFFSEVKIDKGTSDIYPDLPKANGMIINDLMYRHWDSWEDGYYSHVFVADFNNGNVTKINDIMLNEPYDSPLKPFGGNEEISWAPDGKQIAYTCKKLTGKEYAFSTNSDIYLYNIDTKEVKNLTEGMMGYDKAPVFSPDGSKMAWLSMERAGFEADKDRLFILDFTTGEKTYLTADFDYSVSNTQWTDDGNSIFLIAGVNATYQIYKMDVATKEIKAITKGNHDYHSVDIAGKVLVGDKVSITKPAEIYTINPDTGDETEISFINKDILDKLTMPTVE